MQTDFHYYATYCAACLAGYSHEECLSVCYSAQFVDWCSATLLAKLHVPRAAATTQLTMEMADARTDLLGRQISRAFGPPFIFCPMICMRRKRAAPGFTGTNTA